MLNRVMNHWSYTVYDTKQNNKLYIIYLYTLERLRATYLCGEATQKPEPEMHQGESKVLVEEVAEEIAHAVVGPTAMDQQEALQVAKLGKGVVRGQNGLHALLSTDAHTNVGRWREQKCTTDHLGASYMTASNVLR